MPENRPTIVCLCGSARFADAYRDAMRAETLDGKIVLTVGLLGHQERIDMAKIDLADEVLVLSVGGYIGRSAIRGIAYATKQGKRVRWLEDAEAETSNPQTSKV